MSNQAPELAPIIWEPFETNISQIPTYLKNILTLSGFDNIISLQNLDDAAIIEIERFARDQLHLFIPEDAKLEDYYNIYNNNPEMFTIVAGHKILLREIRMYSMEKGAEFFTKFIKRRTYQICQSKIIGEGLNLIPDRCIKKSFHRTAEEHGKVLKHLVNRWINTVKDSDTKNQIKEIHQITVFNPSPDEVSGAVTCSVCHQDIKVSTQSSLNGYKRWIISNFMRHFKIHLGLSKSLKVNDVSVNVAGTSQVPDNNLSYDEWNCDQDEEVDIKIENN